MLQPAVPEFGGGAHARSGTICCTLKPVQAWRLLPNVQVCCGLFQFELVPLKEVKYMKIIKKNLISLKNWVSYAAKTCRSRFDYIKYI